MSHAFTFYATARLMRQLKLVTFQSQSVCYFKKMHGLVGERCLILPNAA